MKAYRTGDDLPQGRKVRARVGRWLLNLHKTKAEAVLRRPFSHPWGVGGRLMRNAHLFNAVESQDHELLHRFHRDYWSSPVAAEFYDQFSNRFEDLFLRHHAGVIDEMASAMESLGARPRELVELGPGDGRVLEYLSQHLSGVDKFYGIDLNEEQIRECEEKYRNVDNLHFRHGDIFRWLEENGSPGRVFFTNGGVCEYLTKEQLRELFTLLRRICNPCVVAVTETLAVDHDLRFEPETWPYGHELAFSHNYPAVLREAGFEIWWQNDRFTEEGEEHHPSRWFQLVATSGARPT